MRDDVRNAVGRRWLEYSVVLIGIAAWFAVALWPTFHADFGVVEDHHVVNDANLPDGGWISRMMMDIPAFGRFRPAFFVFHFGKIWLFGPNARALHVVMVALGVLTCLSFYAAARGAGADIASAVVFVLLFAGMGRQTAIWYHMLSPAEAFAMPLAGVASWALVAAVTRPTRTVWHVVALAAAAMAGLTKESFILVLPALLLARWTLECWVTGSDWKSASWRLRWFLAAGVVVFAVELGLVAWVMSYRPGSYGPEIAGLGWKSFDPVTWYLLLRSSSTALLGAYAIGGLVVLLLGCSVRRSAIRRYAGAVLVTAAAWLVPQLVLYRNGIEERYLLPGVVALAGVVAFGLGVLWRIPRGWARAVWVAGAVSLIPLFSRGVDDMTQAVGRYAADSFVVHAMIDNVVTNVPPSKAIVVMADPATPYGYEAMYAVTTYLKHTTSRSPVYMWRALNPAMQTNLHVGMMDVVSAEFQGPGALSADDVGAIMVMGGPTDVPDAPTWFWEAEWREIVFTRPYRALRLESLGFVPAGEARQRLLVRGREVTAIPSDKPLIEVDSPLTTVVGINPFVRTPPWGIEANGARSLLWLGHPPYGAVTVMLWSRAREAVSITCEVGAGPDGAGDRRTLQVALDSRGERTTNRQTFDGTGTLRFVVTLEPGRNELSVSAVDLRAAAPRGSAHERALNVIVRRIVIARAMPSSAADGRETIADITRDASLAGLEAAPAGKAMIRSDDARL